MSLLSRESRNTLWGIIAVGVGLIVWDVVLLNDGAEDTTISAVMRIMSRLLFFPYGFGVLAGHIFWHKNGPRDDSSLFAGLLVLALIGAILTALALTTNHLALVAYLCNHPHVVFAGIGFPVGHFLWPQYHNEVGA